MTPSYCLGSPRSKVYVNSSVTSFTQAAWLTMFSYPWKTPVKSPLPTLTQLGSLSVCSLHLALSIRNRQQARRTPDRWAPPWPLFPSEVASNRHPWVIRNCPLTHRYPVPLHSLIRRWVPRATGKTRPRHRASSRRNLRSTRCRLKLIRISNLCPPPTPRYQSPKRRTLSHLQERSVDERMPRQNDPTQQCRLDRAILDRRTARSI